jgi:hypothetical protein
VGLCLALYESFQSAAVVFLFYLITDWDCVTLLFIDVRTSTPPMDEVAIVRPPDRNSDAHDHVLFLTGQHQRFLRALSPLWLPYPPQQFLQDSCPGFRAATTAMPSAVTDAPPPRTWPASPIAYVQPGGGSRSRGDTWHPQS